VSRCASTAGSTSGTVAVACSVADGGSRSSSVDLVFMSDRPRRVAYNWHSVENKFLTVASNAFTNLNVSEMETPDEASQGEVLPSIELREDRFGVARYSPLWDQVFSS
jgi:hypothetical protein